MKAIQIEEFGGPEVMKSVNNIWKISDRGGAPVQVTHHTSGNLFFPSISSDGKTIVYEENFGLWKLDVASGKSTEIKIDLLSDDKETPEHWLEAASLIVQPSNVQGHASSIVFTSSWVTAGGDECRS